MSFLNKINEWLLTRKKNCTTEEQRLFLYQLSVNMDHTSYISRSFCQYKCQFLIYNLSVLNIIFFVSYPIWLILPIIFIFYKKRYKTSSNLKSNYQDIVCLPSKAFIPHSVSQKNEYLFLLPSQLKPNFTWTDLVFCYSLIKSHPLSPYFFSKCIYQVYRYSGISKINASSIYVSTEYSFTSSILTLYLKKNKNLVINCMHGEKVFTIRDAFCTYDKCIIWDDFYSQLLNQLKWQCQFEVSSCKAIEIPLNNNKNGNIIFFLQGIESEKDLETIKEKLFILKLRYKCHNILLKPHPRYPTLNLAKVFPSASITEENFTDLVAAASIISSNFSTVLFQAYIAKKNNNSHFPLIAVNDLIELPEMYIMRNKADILFSKVIK